jgi:hypothetical protein
MRILSTNGTLAVLCFLFAVYYYYKLSETGIEVNWVSNTKSNTNLSPSLTIYLTEDEPIICSYTTLNPQ